MTVLLIILIFPGLLGDVLLLCLPLPGAVLLPHPGNHAGWGFGGNRLHVLSKGANNVLLSREMFSVLQYFWDFNRLPPVLYFAQLKIWADVQVWRQAATQVFFALGLGFGSVIAYSSYNPKNNNCHRDAFTVSAINFLTSVFATFVVFAVLGFRAKQKVTACISRYF